MCIFGRGRIVAEIDDGVIDFGIGGRSNTVSVKCLMGEGEVAVFFHAVTHTIGGVRSEGGLLREGDDDGIVLTQLTVAVGITANNGAVVDFGSGYFFYVGSSDDCLEGDAVAIINILQKNGGDSGAGGVVALNRGGSQGPRRRQNRPERRWDPERLWFLRISGRP